MPSLYILAGPNGAGKTTFYFTAIEEGFIDKKLPFINTDLVMRDELGGYGEENFAKAETIVRSRIAYHISNSNNFLIESNLARKSDYDWIRSIKKNGYDIILYFLCIKNVEINIERVKKRVKEDGHNVPENIITHRYTMALLYLRKEIFYFNEVYLIENSDETTKEVALIKNGKLLYTKEESIGWVDKVLYLIKKIHL